MPGEYFLEQPAALDARDNGLSIEATTTNNATLYGGLAPALPPPNGEGTARLDALRKTLGAGHISYDITYMMNHREAPFWFHSGPTRAWNSCKPVDFLSKSAGQWFSEFKVSG